MPPDTAPVTAPPSAADRPKIGLREVASWPRSQARRTREAKSGGLLGSAVPRSVYWSPLAPENDASKVAATGPLERQLWPRRQDAPRAIHPLETTGTRTTCRDTGRSRGPARDPSRDRSSPPTRARHPPATLSSSALRAGEAFADQLSLGQVTQVGDRGETCLTHQRCSRAEPSRAEPNRTDDSDTVTHSQPGQRARAPVTPTRRKRGDASERSDRIVRACAPAAGRSARWARR